MESVIRQVSSATLKAYLPFVVLQKYYSCHCLQFVLYFWRNNNLYSFYINTSSLGWNHYQFYSRFRTALCVYCVDMVIIHLHTKFHLPGSSDSLRERPLSCACYYFTFYNNITLTGVAYFFNIYFILEPATKWYQYCRSNMYCYYWL